MNLAESIYQANEEEQKRPVDEFGLGIWDNVDYYVARALAVSYRSAPDIHSIYLIHKRGDGLYQGHQKIEETKQNITRLAQKDHKFTAWEQMYFWQTLKKNVPKLNLRYLQISDNLVWDKERGEVIPIKEVENEE